MKYGYVCFAYSKNEWVAKAIAWFTKSQWSHSFITVPPMLGKEMVMEAASGGTQTVMFDKAYRNNPNQKYEVYRLKVSKKVVDEAIIKCMERLEMPYGYLEYPWFIWRSINKFFGRDIKNQDNWSQKDEVCSGLASFFVKSAKLKALFSGFGKNSITAQDVYGVVKSHPELFELVESKD